jgi:diaminopimelate dehydrogenase
MQAEHSGIPHGGFVVRGGTTGVNGGQQHVIEYSLKLDSNPEFTASVLTAYARAAWRLFDKGESGCMTVFDIAPKYLSEKSHADLLKTLL